ncbi:hypothetical protein [Pseudomonas peli]|uniref:hypothetical protein n=1 Tax=Pseudomonas peli TaxID=592361 RepID=UPI0031F71421
MQVAQAGQETASTERRRCHPRRRPVQLGFDVGQVLLSLPGSRARARGRGVVVQQSRRHRAGTGQETACAAPDHPAAPNKAKVQGSTVILIGMMFVLLSSLVYKYLFFKAITQGKM